MGSLVATLPEVQSRLDTLARVHRVPGATLAIAHGDEMVDFATGVVNTETGVAATPDSLFQIGSNTKLLTTTLLMQLVDEGLVDLDAPVQRYLPEFRLDDATAAREITVRQTLTHTSGIQGDYFDGFGRGDEAIQRYVESLSKIDLIHRPGERWSYCNSAFVVVGHLVERVRGKPFRDVLRERLLEPVGLRRASVVTEEMIAWRCAVGHVIGPRGRPVVPPIVVMEYAQTPAGSRTASTAMELVRFVQMHLNGGVARNGKRVLSADSVAAMQHPQVARPATSTAPLTQGLGWLMEEWDGHRVIGHGGGTIGQLSYLQAIPDAGLAVVLLTNSVTGGLLWRDLGRWLFEEFAGVRMATAPTPPTPPPDVRLDRYTGVFERLGSRLVFSVEDDRLTMRTEATGAMASIQESPPPVPLTALDDERFLGGVPGTEIVIVFSDFAKDRPQCVFASRLARRVDSGPRGKKAVAARKKR